MLQRPRFDKKGRPRPAPRTNSTRVISCAPFDRFFIMAGAAGSALSATGRTALQCPSTSRPRAPTPSLCLPGLPFVERDKHPRHVCRVLAGDDQVTRGIGARPRPGADGDRLAPVRRLRLLLGQQRCLLALPPRQLPHPRWRGGGIMAADARGGSAAHGAQHRALPAS